MASGKLEEEREIKLQYSDSSYYNKIELWLQGLKILSISGHEMEGGISAIISQVLKI